MRQVKPYYIAPLLIEQPTWGGQYITEFKGISEPTVIGKNIGQAYELAHESLLIDQPTQPAFSLAEATDINHPVHFGVTESQPIFPLAELIAEQPEAVLGQAVAAKHGPKMPLLIKFTQAQNNSYQLHIKTGQQLGTWQPKPESWYYFEPGRATLGLKAGASIDEYKVRCLAIEAEAQKISHSIKQGQITVAEGRQQLTAFIDQDHPRRFVNSISIPAESVIDLSAGGLHHSWEVDPNLPKGNILLEVQLDVKDDISTLRSFDQGSIKDNGDVRPLTIEDYFKVIDTTPEANDPATSMRTSQETIEGNTQVKVLFANQYYHLISLKIKGEYGGPHTQTTEGFHHLFVKDGQATIKTSDQSLLVHQGWSLFIPAAVGEYSIISDHATILKTTI